MKIKYETSALLFQLVQIREFVETAANDYLQFQIANNNKQRSEYESLSRLKKFTTLEPLPYNRFEDPIYLSEYFTVLTNLNMYIRICSTDAKEITLSSEEDSALLAIFKRYL